MAPALSKFNFNYSQKNIPIASKKQHKIQLLHSVDKTVTSMDWKTYFALNPDKKVSRGNYGFKSIRATPYVPEMNLLKKRLASMVANVEYRNYSNNFQKKLKEDLNVVNNETKLFIQADKTIKQPTCTR